MRHTTHHRKSHADNLAFGVAPRTVGERNLVSCNTTPSENGIRLIGKSLSARRMPMSGDVYLVCPPLYRGSATTQPGSGYLRQIRCTTRKAMSFSFRHNLRMRMVSGTYICPFRPLSLSRLRTLIHLRTTQISHITMFIYLTPLTHSFPPTCPEPSTSARTSPSSDRSPPPATPERRDSYRFGKKPADPAAPTGTPAAATSFKRSSTLADTQYLIYETALSIP